MSRDNTISHWSCDACGCRTNTVTLNSESCAACGTARRGAASAVRRRLPSQMRRRIIRRDSTFRNLSDAENNDEVLAHEEDSGLGNSLDHEILGNVLLERMADSSTRSALDLLIRDNSLNLHRIAAMTTGRRYDPPTIPPSDGNEIADFLQDERPSQQVQPPSLTIDPELFTIATQNASLYNPMWSLRQTLEFNRTRRHGRSKSSKRIQDTVDISIINTHPNVAYLPERGQVCCTVAQPSFPLSLCIENNPTPRRVFGFRVAFDHPNREAGANMGGYFIGVTNSSHFLWGVEDGGRTYERTTHFPGSFVRRIDASNPAQRYRSRIAGNESCRAPPRRNDAPSLASTPVFGFKDIVTVVLDLDSQTLTYWKNDLLLGTLVRNIDNTEKNFPVAIPVNSSVSVAITGITGDPLLLLSKFQESQRERREDQLNQRRQTLSKQREVLIIDGKPTEELIRALTNIFSWYIPKGFPKRSITHLTSVQASRLWYRCGIKLSHLRSLLDASQLSSKEAKDGQIITEPYISVDDFIDIISSIIAKDECIPKSIHKNLVEEVVSKCADGNTNINVPRVDGLQFQVGDHVVIAENYEQFGDVSCGPLSPGVHGIVVESSNESEGKNNLIRVMCNGRRWYYQPQALILERSGLVESATIRFLLKILRSHGYDEKIQPLWGKPLSKVSWQEGDFVTYSPCSKIGAKATTGRVVEGVQNLMSLSRSALMLHVECPNHSFGGRGAGMLNTTRLPIGLSRRLPIKNLRHTTFYHGLLTANDMMKDDDNISQLSIDNFCVREESICLNKVNKGFVEKSRETENGSLFQCDDVLKSNIVDIERLNIAAMKVLEGECKRNPASLPAFFAMGLSAAILSAFDNVTDSLQKSIKNEKNTLKMESTSIISLGSLVCCVCKHLFSSLESYNHSDIRKTESLEEHKQLSGETGNTSCSSLVESSNIIGANDDSRAVSLVHTEEDSPIYDDSQSLSIELNHRSRASLVMISNDFVDSTQYRSPKVLSDSQSEGATRDLHPLDPNTIDPQISRFVISHDEQPSNIPEHQMPPNSEHTQNASLNAGAEDIFLETEPNDLSLNTQRVGIDLDHPQLNSALNSESSARAKSVPILQCLLRGSKVPFFRLAKLQTSKARQVNSVSKSLINNGLLNCNIMWVKRSLELRECKSINSNNGIINTMCDEDGWPPLLLAVSFGCSIAILKALIESGSRVTKREIHEAAISNQTRSLSYLLRHTVYVEGTLDLSLVTNNVRDIIRSALERQQEEKTKMRKEMAYFTSCILQKLLNIALIARLNSRQQTVSSYFHDCSNAATDFLVGKVIFNALYSNQEEARKKLPSSCKVSKVKSPLERQQYSQSQCQQLSEGLLNVLPPYIIIHSLYISSESDDQPDENNQNQSIKDDSVSTSVLLFKLIESFLWSRDIPDIAVGLSLARYLLVSEPFHYCDQIERYGIKELAILHAKCAEECLSQLVANNMFICKSQARCTKTACAGTVFCPQGHLSEVHMTKHSDFRCNLCGNGVEKGYLMYGCRTCDWDACQKCMDRCQGGYVKWKLISHLALKCQSLISNLRNDRSHLCVTRCDGYSSNFHEEILLTTNVRKDNIQRISRGIMRLQTNSVQELEGLLHRNNEVTIHEFCNFLLPSLHAAITGNVWTASRKVNEGSVTPYPFRQYKKPRLSSLSSSVFDGKDRENFVREILTSLIAEPIKRDLEKRNLNSIPAKFGKKPTCSTDAANEVVKMEIVETDEDENEYAEDLSDNKERNTNDKELRSEIQLPFVPPLLQYLHTILTFHERATNVESQHTVQSKGELHTLLIPFEIDLQPAPMRSYEQNYIQNEQAQSNSKPKTFSIEYSKIYLEPLISMSDLTMHILRSRPIQLEGYIQFCRRLVDAQTVIVEPPTNDILQGSDKSSASLVRIARVLAFDEHSGAHIVKYASELIPIDSIISNSNRIRSFLNQVDFSGQQLMLLLAVRDYYILNSQGSCKVNEHSKMVLSGGDGIISNSRFPEVEKKLENIVCPSDLEIKERDKDSTMLKVGTRVECKLNLTNDSWQHFTVKEIESTQLKTLPNIFDGGPCYTVVCDKGVVFPEVTSDKIRDYQSLLQRQCCEKENKTVNKTEEAQRMLFGTRMSRNGRPGHAAASSSEPNTLRRTWSALSLTQNLESLDASPLNSKTATGSFTDNLDLSIFGKPPQVEVEFSLHDESQLGSYVSFSSFRAITFFSALQHLLVKSSRKHDLLHQRKCRLFYSFSCSDLKLKPVSINAVKDCLPLTFSPPWSKTSVGRNQSLSNSSQSFYTESRNRSFENLSSIPNSLNAHTITLDGICLQAINVLCIMADRLHRTFETNVVPIESNGNYRTMSIAKLLKMFQSEYLSKKLIDQLEEPMTVCSGGLPDWCTVMPTYTPVLFSHTSRRLFLNRYAFGVSRSLLRQQESKVAVQELRQRMAALRGRAVELVGEAFSGEASDPMALQLQADELYGMEEALQSRVAAAFSSQKWQERSLESVKAVVHRDSLLIDSILVMGNYSTASHMKNRRLEVRFEGESGFDAASGDKAGVTRGFYADVAELLLSCDNVAGINSISTLKNCLHRKGLFFDAKKVKVPLWIPDMDPSGNLIIPSPRADHSSTLGVFPMPIAPNHPQSKRVLELFQLMGRLFAAAMRDGFTFPLPLSASFFKLVQVGADSAKRQSNNNTDSGLNTGHSSSVISCHSNVSDPFPLPSSTLNGSGMSNDDSSNICDSLDSFGYLSDAKTNGSYFGEYISPERKNPVRLIPSELKIAVHKLNVNCGRDRFNLGSCDLPRPGFLGGEVFAIEEHICNALDQLDTIAHTLPRSEFLRRKKELSIDSSFAKRAFGKTFECSFAEYVEDKTFVDPLDPMQDENAFPLCPNGHLRPVSIENVREWVLLAKQFILYDGIIAQAVAFRQGVNDFFPIGVLRLFTAEELQRDICGGGDDVCEWDEDAIRSLLKLDGGKGAAEALIAVAAIGGEGGAVLSRRFGHSSPTIGYLVGALLEATEFQRRQFLSFVTSVPIVTPGQIEVVPILNPSGDFLSMSDPRCLPRANTCGRRLYLPKFDSYESFSKVLWAVVTAECRFKGFFEWRG